MIIQHIIEECVKYTKLCTNLEMSNYIAESLYKDQVMKIIKFLTKNKIINVQF